MSKITIRIDRRRFLEISGGATAALISACSGNTERSPTSSPGAGGSDAGQDTAPGGSGGGRGGSGPTGSGGAAGGATGSGSPDAADVADGSTRDVAGGESADAADAKVADAGPPPPLTEADWQALASSLSGTVIRPGNMLYNQARVVFNTRFDSI